MHGIRPEEQELLDLLFTYGPLLEEQLIRYFYKLDTGMLLSCLQKKRLIRREKEYIIPGNAYRDINSEAVKAFEVIILFKDRISFHCPSDPPFAISYLKDQKVFDIVAVTEVSLWDKCREVDSSSSERVVFVTDTIHEARKITTKKEAGICVLRPETKLFEFGGI